MSHYYPRHVSGLDMPILRRNNCTNTASGILALELSEQSGTIKYEYRIAHLIPERGYQMLCLCICSSWGWACQGPKHIEDDSVTYMLLLNCALKLVEEIILYCDARSKKHKKNPRHVSSINMPIFRRTNCIITASGIVTLCTVQPFTDSDDTRCCDNTICPPEDGHVNARNVSRIVI